MRRLFLSLLALAAAPVGLLILTVAAMFVVVDVTSTMLLKIWSPRT